MAIDPDNSAARSRLEDAKQQRSETRPTVPSTIADELQFNVFMRTRDPKVCIGVLNQLEMLHAAKSGKDTGDEGFDCGCTLDELLESPVMTMTHLRKLKDKF